MLGINTINSTRLNHTMHDMQIEERQSLDALKIFVAHACEVLSLWKILCEHQIHLLIASMNIECQNALANTTFKDLILFGHDVCSALIVSLINSYLGDNASVDSISNKLRDVCPNLYKSEDAACSKVCFCQLMTYFVYNELFDFRLMKSSSPQNLNKIVMNEMPCYSKPYNCTKI